MSDGFKEVMSQADFPTDLSLYTYRGLFALMLHNQTTVTKNQVVLMATVQDLKDQLDKIQQTESDESAQLSAEHEDTVALGTALHQIITMIAASPNIPAELVQQATDIAAAALANTQAATQSAADVASLDADASAVATPTTTDPATP
jgi:hypothetical protein